VRRRLADGSVAAAAFILAASLLAGTEKAVTLQRIDVTRLPAIDVYFTVTDAGGSSVLGLTTREVSVAIDGQPQAITSLSSALAGGASLAVTLLFDRSGSVQGAQGGIKDAAIEFLSRMGRDDQLAVVSFDDTVKVDAPLSTDRAATARAIREIRGGRNTALYDAIQSALGLLNASSAKRQAILVLSDGRDTSSRTRRDEVLAAAKMRGVPIFSLGVGASVDAGALERLAHDTGGDALTAAQPDELRVLYQKIGDRLANQYVMSFTSSFGEDGAWRKLGVAVQSPGANATSAPREFLATKSMGVSRELVSSAEQRAERIGRAAFAAIGAAVGLVAGVLLVLAIRMARPGVPLQPVLVAAVIVLAGIVGGIVSVLVQTLGT